MGQSFRHYPTSITCYSRELRIKKTLPSPSFFIYFLIDKPYKRFYHGVYTGKGGDPKLDNNLWISEVTVV